ncbi:MULTISPECIES: Ldh family oxidoreductase [unclassified Aeromicrobium]|uniref:Ldh family oxidoreductase n=1 Tax=unclassified Aeromicrobium TaxID=2633570 RepID=UPI00396AF84D
MPVLTIPEAHQLVSRCMQSIGYPASDASDIADHLIDAELRGFSFGGLPRGLSVIERSLATAKPFEAVTVLKETPISATFDGGDQVGYVVGLRATETAITKALEHGISVVGARNTWYTGMFTYYLEKITAAGLVGMIAGSSGQFVAPFGGSEGRFGTNPIAFGFPSADDPIIWDIGTAAIMYGEVVLASRTGQPLAEGLAYGPDGHPTTDATAALEGAFTVWGGHKGSGLALVVQLLGMMTGASENPEGVSDVGFFVTAVDPEILTSREEYAARVASYADQLRATRPIDPSRPVRVPFERSARHRRDAVARGMIEVEDVVLNGLLKHASGRPS